MHSKYGLEKKRLYNFWSLDSQNQGVFLHTLLASDFSSSKISSLRNNTIGSIQLDPTLIWWIWTISLFTSIGLHKSSTRMTQGKSCAEKVARVARKSACVFPFLGICSKLKDLNPNYKCLTWFKYSCILTSLASNSPLTWPTTNLESENISTAFLPIFWTMAIPANRALCSASLFMVEKPSLKDFSVVTFLGDSRTSPSPKPLDLLRHQHIPSRIKAPVRRPCQLIFHPCPTSPPLLLLGIQRTRLPNLRGPDS